jgi:hypothetical protein
MTLGAAALVNHIAKTLMPQLSNKEAKKLQSLVVSSQFQQQLLGT